MKMNYIHEKRQDKKRQDKKSEANKRYKDYKKKNRVSIVNYITILNNSGSVSLFFVI